jgi:hypothetical protein
METMKSELVAPDGITFVPTYMPTIKASGGHQQMMCEAVLEFES